MGPGTWLQERTPLHARARVSLSLQPGIKAHWMCFPVEPGRRVRRECGWSDWKELQSGHVFPRKGWVVVVHHLGHCFRVGGQGFVQEGRAGLGKLVVSHEGGGPNIFVREVIPCPLPKRGHVCVCWAWVPSVTGSTGNLPVLARSGVDSRPDVWVLVFACPFFFHYFKKCRRVVRIGWWCLPFFWILFSDSLTSSVAFFIFLKKGRTRMRITPLSIAWWCSPSYLLHVGERQKCCKHQTAPWLSFG